MSRKLASRGPDDEGYLGLGSPGREIFTQNPDDLAGMPVGLAHRRLAILDLSAAGRQPMSSSDGRLHLVFNGEIYNYIELREELEAAGHRFVSQCDTEVLLAGLDRWGRDVFGKLVGMFAFAFIDTHRRTLLLARDCFGIKPLYYTCDAERLAFSSTIPALLVLPDLRRRVSAPQIYDYLRFGLTDHGQQTLFADINQVPPGTWMEFNLDNPLPAEPQRYWSPPAGDPVDISFDQAAEMLREMFLESIDLHLRSDVMVGTCLSGGIDSSSIIAAMRAVKGDGLAIHAVSYIADDPALNEQRWVALSAEAAGATVHTVGSQAEDLQADLDELIASQGQPFGSTSIFAQRCVFQRASQEGLTVMLDGQGADELLGGYHPHLAARLASLLRNGRIYQAFHLLGCIAKGQGIGAGEALARALGLLLGDSFGSVGRKLTGKELLPGWLDADWFSSRGVVPTFSRRRGRNILLDTLRDAVSETSLPMLLRYEDRNAMAFSIENRTPFLTPKIAEFILSLPESHLISRDGQSKAVFRQAMRGIVPDAILDRRDKIGFATPEARWLGRLGPWVEQTLSGDVAAEIPALKLDVVRRQAREVLGGGGRFDTKIWRWINLIKWTECFEVDFSD